MAVSETFRLAVRWVASDGKRAGADRGGKGARAVKPSIKNPQPTRPGSKANPGRIDRDAITDSGRVPTPREPGSIVNDPASDRGQAGRRRHA
jgi:hypothetical protein